jgi:poly-beta-1,6-N-acetyl-D-glucosamine synthase
MRMVIPVSLSLVVLVGSLALIGWTYLGYPLLMALMARWWARPVATRAWEPSVSVCLCVHNALALLPEKVADVLGHDYPAGRLQLVIVDDGSSDGTAEWLNALAGNPRIAVVSNPQRRGKSACLADALALAANEVLVFTDVRQKFEPGSISRLCAALWSGGYRVVGGALEFRSAQGYARSLDAYRRYESWLRYNESASGSVIGVSGALYALRRTDMPVPPAGLILDDVWVPMTIARQGGRVGLEPRAIAWDEPCANPAQEARRKRRTLAGNWQLLALWPGLLLPWRNPLWLRFISHKVMRLLVPFALVAALVSNVLLLDAHPLMAGLFAVQVAGYLCALAGWVWPTLRRILPVRLATTFVEMNAYAALGLLDFLRDRNSHLWSSPHAPVRAPGATLGSGR